VGRDKRIICVDCGSSGYSKKHTKGNIFIELILWCFLLVPGLIYSVWRMSSREDVCQGCGSNRLLPINSPKGKALYEQYKGNK
jgi:hypothetical protein